MSVALLVVVFVATFAYKMLAWRFVRWLDQGRRNGLRAEGKVGLFASERWRRG